MLAILTLFTVIIVSLLVVRVATVALTLTGLSREVARFQARSAFTGTGFPASEAESVIQHPVRRRIIMLLMLLGNAGIVTAMSTLILSFINLAEHDKDPASVWLRAGWLCGGLLLLFFIAQSHWLDEQMHDLIGWALKRWTSLELRDYSGLLHLAGEYAVYELNVKPDDWVAGKYLKEIRLNHEGVLVLGIEKPDGCYIGTPRGEIKVAPFDKLILYGRQKVLIDLDQRKTGYQGTRAHHQVVREQKQVEAVEKEIARQAEQKEDEIIKKRLETEKKE